MSDGLNKVMLFGNLGADPELRITGSGQAILKLRIATAESYLDKSNTRQERTEWHSVTVWGKRGEALGKILHKGDRIFIEGGLRTSSYEKNGEKRYRTEVVASNVILGGKGGSAPQQERTERAPAQQQQAPAHDSGGDYSGNFDMDDGEIPFAVPLDVGPSHVRRRSTWERW